MYYVECNTVIILNYVLYRLVGTIIVLDYLTILFFFLKKGVLKRKIMVILDNSMIFFFYREKHGGLI